MTTSEWKTTRPPDTDSGLDTDSGTKRVAILANDVIGWEVDSVTADGESECVAVEIPFSLHHGIPPGGVSMKSTRILSQVK